MKKGLSSNFNSRQYMVSKGFELFFYSNRNFHTLASHAHDYFEYYFFVEGEVDMEICGNLYPLSPGDVILVPPGMEHRAIIRNAETSYRRFVLWVSTDYHNELLSRSADYGFLPENAKNHGEFVYHFDTAQFNALYGKLVSTLEELNTAHFGRDTRIAICLYDLFLLLNRMAFEQKHPIHKELYSSYEAIADYIDQHITEDLSLDTLSREFFLNKFYIAHMFQEMTGLSLHQLIIKKRLAIGKNALHCGATAAEACSLAGFKEYSNFYRAFKKEYSFTPAAYQKKNKRIINELNDNIDR